MPKVWKRTWKNKDGSKGHSWRVNFVIKATGERIRDTLEPTPTSRKDAEEKAALLYADMENGTSTTPNTKAVEATLTLEDLLTAHRGRSGISANTKEIEKHQGKNLTTRLGETTPVSRITIKDLDEYAEARKDDTRGKYSTKKISGATIRKELKLLNQALRWAQTRDLPTRLPFTHLPTVRVEKKKPRCLVSAEIKKLLDACGADTEYLRQAVEVCYLTGLRRSELFRMQWTDIDFDKARLAVVTHKRGSSDYVVTDYVYLSKRAMALLKARRKSLGKVAPDGLVFGVAPRVWQGVESTVDQTFSDAIERAAKRAGIAKPTEVGAHTLRHSCATEMLNSGATVPEVASHLRHRDGGALVLSTYGHAHETGLRNVAAILANEVPKKKAAQKGTKSRAQKSQIKHG